MALKEYEWNGRVYQIADEDVPKYPGAVPVEKKAVEPEAKKAKAPANKSRKSAKTKGGESK